MHADDIIGLSAVLLLFGTPLIAMLLRHQRKMAEMFHQQALAAGAPNAETQELRNEIRELKALVHQQTIALDNLNRPLPSHDRLQETVRG
jgi:hypothetical protein